MTLDTITIEDALKLMSLPRTLGDYEEVAITVQNGRYGPYMTHGTDSRTLTSEDQLFAITLDEAIELYKQPKVRRRGVAKPPLKDLGIDPASQKAVLVKDGRFGIYITDGDCTAPKTQVRKPILWVHSSRSSINEDLPGTKIKIN
jgi:DNA topoisomerase-1